MWYVYFKNQLKMYKNFYNYEKKSFFSSFRSNRSILIKQFLLKVYKSKKNIKIVDLGGSEDYWINIFGIKFLKKINAKITIINIDNLKIKKTEIFDFLKQDACNSTFDDSYFDLAFSNSVIEHVGNFKKQILFAKEHLRLAKFYYCQTPNKSFFMDPHTFVPYFFYLNKNIQIFLLKNFSLGNYQKAKNNKEAKKIIKETQMLSFNDFKYLFAEKEITIEKFLFMNKSFIATNIRKYRN